jgi:acetamidase/formamidase
MRQQGKIHRLVAGPQTVHTGYFSCSFPPVLHIESGDTVVLNTMTMMDDQIKSEITYEQLLNLSQNYVDREGYDEHKGGPHTLTGPIFVNGAEPGDVLEVRIEKLVPIDWGVNFCLPGSMDRGGLPEHFPLGQLRMLKFNLRKMETVFAPGIIIPLRPFLGVMGVSPKAGEKRPSAIPEYFGGNMDNKELVAGTTLYLPVNVHGALFSAGDAHAAQGDGEVCLTAIETAVKEAVLQFMVRKDLKLEGPMAETATHWITMGFHRDLDEALKIALRKTIQFLVDMKGLTRVDAYTLSSVAVDFRITQIVNVNKGIHAMIPKAIFGDQI